MGLVLQHRQMPPACHPLDCLFIRMSAARTTVKRSKCAHSMRPCWLMCCRKRDRIIYRRWCCSTVRTRPSTRLSSKSHRIDRMRYQPMLPFDTHLLDSEKLDATANSFRRNQNQSNVCVTGHGRLDFQGSFSPDRFHRPVAFLEILFFWAYLANRNNWDALQSQMSALGKCSIAASGCRSSVN